MAKLGFIGMGNMGYAILKGVKGAFDLDDIIFHSKTVEKMKKISNEEGIRYVESNREVVQNSKYIILAVKPQMFDDVIAEINNALTDEKILISLAPGITIEQLQKNIKRGRVVRTMPNTPAMVSEGMTGVCFDEDKFTEEEICTVEKIFTSVGKMKKIDEKSMDGVVCASGSSPAYVFMFIEALADSVVKCGIKRADAYELTAQTVLGSAKLMLETGKHPGELKDMVCSPGGTTISGVAELEKNGFRKAIFEATEACYERCRNM